MLVTKQIEFDMGHRVPNHKSKCKNLHGHRYKIEVGVDDKVIQTKGVSNEGMVIDFGDLKQIMIDEIDSKFDHSFMLYSQDEFKPYFEAMRQEGQKIVFTDFIPTAENICHYFFLILNPALKKRTIKLKYVKVWETPTSTATYEDN